MTRNEKIWAARRAGETLQTIGDRWGLSRERVRQLCHRHAVPQIRCRRCQGEARLRSVSDVPLCHDCRTRNCVTCGKSFSRAQFGQDDSDSHRSCRREIRGAKGGTTYRAVEKGVYQRRYLETGVVLDGFFVVVGHTYARFSTLTGARKERARIVRERKMAKK